MQEQTHAKPEAMRAKTLNAIPDFDFVYVKGMFCERIKP